MSEPTFGWELTFRSVKDEVNSQVDILIAFIHFFLLKNNFKNVGIGDDRTLTDADLQNQSELLPEGWNLMDGGVYKLRYVNNGKIFILNGLLSEDLVIVNLLNGENLDVSNASFVLNTVVPVTSGSANSVINNPNEIWQKLDTQLLQPVFKGNTKAVETQTTTATTSQDTRSLPQLPSVPRRDPLLVYEPPRLGRFPEVGRGDLDPFGQGSGSLFEPPRAPVFQPGRGGFPGGPLGAIPPEARFDPIGPYAPGRSPRFDPDPDHERPPGYDDMFM